MERILHANEATITTATIEVKVMRIGTKQVTQAVFKQLPEIGIIYDKTGKLGEGIPWGRVNYHIGCEGVTFQHLHIVWQEGNTLYRSIVATPWSSGSPESTYERLDKLVSRYAHAYLIAIALEGWIPDTCKTYTGVPYISHGTRFTVNLGGHEIVIYTDKEFESLWHKKEGIVCIDNYYANKLITKVLEDGLPLNSSAIEDKFIPLMKQKEELRAAWEKTYAQLEQLDQLFIAV